MVYLILRYFQWKSNRYSPDTFFFRIHSSSDDEKTVVKYAKSQRPGECFTAQILDFLVYVCMNLFES